MLALPFTLNINPNAIDRWRERDKKTNIDERFMPFYDEFNSKKYARQTKMPENIDEREMIRSDAQRF